MARPLNFKIVAWDFQLIIFRVNFVFLLNFIRNPANILLFFYFSFKILWNLINKKSKIYNVFFILKRFRHRSFPSRLWPSDTVHYRVQINGFKQFGKERWRKRFKDEKITVVKLEKMWNLFQGFPRWRFGYSEINSYYERLNFLIFMIWVVS